MFTDKCVVVTGAGSGFGKAIAEKFSAAGAGLVLADIDFAAADNLAKQLPNAVPVKADVASEEDNQKIVEIALEHFDKINVYCANAGVPHRVCSIIDMSVEDFDRMFAINTRSVFLAAKYAVPHMPAGSSFVSTASIGGKHPRPGLSPYNASKAAVMNLTRGMAGELAPKVRVNAVCPVSAATGFDLNAIGQAQLSDAMNSQVVAGIPMGRRAEPSDVANAIYFLASDEAAFLTGVCLDVDGGRSI